MYWTELSDDQIAYARRRAAILEKRFLKINPNPEVLKDRYFIGECGEVAFANWLRHWSMKFRQMPVGWPYDFEVNGYRVEVATSQVWKGDKNDQYLKRQPSTLERNAKKIDVFVGAAMEHKNSSRLVVYCSADREQMVDAPLRRFRSDAPRMHALKYPNETNSTTYLKNLLLDAFPECASFTSAGLAHLRNKTGHLNRE